MRFVCLMFFFLLVSGLGFCQSPKPESEDEKIVVAVKENKKYGVTATFYGKDYRNGENDKAATKVIKEIVFRENKTGAEIKYSPTGTESAADFYFTEIWSPDEEYVVLPIGKFEGFGIFEAKETLNNIKSNKYYDALKVKTKNSGFFWHDFDKWENDSTFGFRAGLNGELFAFKYDIAKNELYCYEAGCEENDIGKNIKDNVKTIKKGDIKPIKIH